jgi:hypothetical protein
VDGILVFQQQPTGIRCCKSSQLASVIISERTKV